MSSLRNPSILVLLAAVAINMTGVGLIWPILPSMVERLHGGTVSEVAAVYGALAVGFSVAQFIFAPIMGLMSDRYGRRPVMLIALLALGIDTAMIAVAPSIFWVFVARIIGGALASTFAIANASMADLLKPEERAAGFGLVGAAFGAGFVVGPLIGGVAGSFDPRLPFLIAAGLSLANAAIGYFFLKETLPREKRSSTKLRIANPFRTLLGLFQLPGMAPLALAFLLAATIQRGLESIWVLFTGAQYGWSVRDAGISLAVVGLSFILVQGILVRPVVKRFGERATMIAGLSVSAAVYVLLAFNTNSSIGYVGIIPHVLGWGLATPALQAIASRKVAADKQGALQGGLSAVQGLSAILGPVFSSALFSYFTSSAAPFQFPGAYFLAGSAVLLAAVIIASRTAN